MAKIQPTKESEATGSFRISREVIPFFKSSGPLWEVVDPQGQRLCAVQGAREDAERVVSILNDTGRMK